MKPYAEIGVFGGSGFYSFLDKVEEVKVDTPYGAPSDLIAIGEIAGRRVAFLPRHGRQHSIPPHRINYRANLWAMKELGVTRIISPCAAGSLHIWRGRLAMCVVNISLITDYDSGLVAEGEVAPVTAEEVMQVFHRNAARIREVIFGMIAKIPTERHCPCPHVLEHARVIV
jgi:purine nucleoside phosphorylase